MLGVLFLRKRRSKKEIEIGMLRIERRLFWLFLHVVGAVLAIHYFLTPFELGTGGATSYAQRLIFGAIFLLLTGLGGRLEKRAEVLFLFFIITAAWFFFINFPENVGPLLYFFAFLGCAFLAPALLGHGEKLARLSLVLDCLLIFWFFSLVFQVAFYFATSNILDVHGFFYPSSAARIPTIGNLVRFTGVHIEPGTYSNWIFGLVLLRAVVSGRLYDKLALAAMASTALTMSAWGAVAIGIYFSSLAIAVLRSLNSRLIGRLLLFVGLFAVVMVYVAGKYFDELWDFSQYLLARSELEDASGASKVTAFAGFLSLILDVAVLGKPLSFDFCGGCLSPQDAGIFINLAVRGGVIFAVFLFGVIGFSLVRIGGGAAILLLGPLAGAKFYYFDPIFWLIFGFSIYFLVASRVENEGNSRL